MLGITGIQVKTFDAPNGNPTELNEFLEEFDGYIIDIKTAQLAYGITRYIVIYKLIEE